MKILFHRYGSICEPDIIEAFQSFGCEIVEEDSEIHQKNIASDVRIKVLAEHILEQKPDYVFSINFFPYISEVCQKLKCAYICLSVDCPVLEFFSKSIKNSCNRIFLFDYNQYLQFKDENLECIFYLPLGTNVERWDRVLYSQADDEMEKQKWLYDVSFIGSLYVEKSPLDTLILTEYDRGMIDGLLEAQLLFNGLDLVNETVNEKLTKAVKNAKDISGKDHFGKYMLENAFTDTDNYVVANYYMGMSLAQIDRIKALNMLAQSHRVDLFTRSDTSMLQGVYCHEGASTHQEMPVIFNRSRINLNITMRPIQTGLSQRVWDVLGCRGFLLSNYQAEIPEHLEPGVHLDCYENLAELNEKVAFYLENEDRRIEIARRGYEAVKEKHTCRHRVAEILKIVLTMHL